MEDQEIRWIQRFNNYEKALKLLEEATQIKEPDMVQKAGMIQFFEMSFELAWNLLKDYFEEQGFTDIKSPRSALKKAFETGITDQGHAWMEILTDRNLASHTYDEQKATELALLIKVKYYPLMKTMFTYFKQKINAN